MLKKPYIYARSSSRSYSTGIQLPAAYRFYDKGKLWLEISKNGRLTVSGGYAWDGCSPKIKLFGMVFGVPEGPISDVTGYPQTYDASLFHDALCQFQNHPSMPFSRDQIDRFFYDLLVRDGFEKASLYYKVVRFFGPTFSRFVSGRVIK